MSDRKQAPLLSKKGQAFNKLVVELNHPAVETRTASVSVRAPVMLIEAIDALAKRTKRTRSQVVVMFLDAVMNELGAEISATVRGIVGSAARKAPVEGKKAAR